MRDLRLGTATLRPLGWFPFLLNASITMACARGSEDMERSGPPQGSVRLNLWVLGSLVWFFLECKERPWLCSSCSLRPGAAPVRPFERCGHLTKRSTRERFDCKAPTCKGSVSYAGEAFGWHRKLQACLLGSLVQRLDHRHPEGCCLQRNPDRGFPPGNGLGANLLKCDSCITTPGCLRKMPVLVTLPFPPNNATGNIGGALT